ncbi:hypothetical protein ACFPRL_26125 [Pseudoclavibacter helvolus]
MTKAPAFSPGPSSRIRSSGGATDHLERGPHPHPERKWSGRGADTKQRRSDGA